ncbi:hypothetical protein [Kitasatospora sp. NPDC058046]|uniref:hypothetical protein n=1 Tax=Kitasatospora sp. NPDC058046 TaxID=3346312 RepID=UPI0036DAA888
MTMLIDYADLGCAEVVNSSRAAAYVRAHCLPVDCEDCPSLPQALGHAPYTNPSGDDAPWYDPNIPESAGFLGVMGLDAAGFQASTVSRSPVQLVGDGAALGIVRRAHREIAYTVLLIAVDECALSYGLAWLSSALDGAGCGGTCTGETLTTFACCPTGDGSAQRRYLYDVALLEGPKVTEAEYLAEAIIAKVEFVLGAAKPWIFRDPLPGTTVWSQLAAGAQVTLDPDAIYGLCVEPGDCLDDPACPPPALPVRPPVPVDACYPSGSATFRRTVISIPPTDMYQWLEAVPILELETGASDLRRLIVRLRPNVLGDCSLSPDPCGICSDIQIPYLPAGSTLRVDGRVQRAEVQCNAAGTATSAPLVYGRQGHAFEWPVFDCPTGLCIEILSTAATTASDARARVLLTARADAG